MLTNNLLFSSRTKYINLDVRTSRSSLFFCCGCVHLHISVLSYNFPNLKCDKRASAKDRISPGLVLIWTLIYFRISCSQLIRASGKGGRKDEALRSRYTFTIKSEIILWTEGTAADLVTQSRPPHDLDSTVRVDKCVYCTGFLFHSIANQFPN